ncbi:hypothetical protein D3C75_1156540 [compost metagenome]
MCQQQAILCCLDQAGRLIAQLVDCAAGRVVREFGQVLLHTIGYMLYITTQLAQYLQFSGVIEQCFQVVELAQRGTELLIDATQQTYLQFDRRLLKIGQTQPLRDTQVEGLPGTVQPVGAQVVQ